MNYSLTGPAQRVLRIRRIAIRNRLPLELTRNSADQDLTTCLYGGFSRWENDTSTRLKKFRIGALWVGGGVRIIQQDTWNLTQFKKRGFTSLLVLLEHENLWIVTKSFHTVPHHQESNFHFGNVWEYLENPKLLLDFENITAQFILAVKCQGIGNCWNFENFRSWIFMQQDLFDAQPLLRW